ncbi:unnamed protein product [Closterium sp. Naga37s-1]|nr:unnamed protein product [Closterium sp. Naga37s-1]
MKGSFKTSFSRAEGGAAMRRRMLAHEASGAGLKKSLFSSSPSPSPRPMGAMRRLVLVGLKEVGQAVHSGRAKCVGAGA